MSLRIPATFLLGVVVAENIAGETTDRIANSIDKGAFRVGDCQIGTSDV